MTFTTPVPSKAEKARVRSESQSRGIGAALNVLGDLVQAAQERAQAAYRAMEVKIRRREEAEAASEKVRKMQYLQAWSRLYLQEERQNRKLRCDYGKLLGGALLITFVDLFVAIPAHVALFAPLVIPGTQPLTPAAVKAIEILDVVFVLPANILGLALIQKSGCTGGQ